MATEKLPTIKLESFEGPFDLLIELTRKHKVDLATISLRTITDDFLVYIQEHALPTRLQADFLVVAATLMLIKIRRLLPSLTQEEEEEIELLTDRVRIYQLYRQKAGMLMQQWGKLRLWPAHFWGSDEYAEILPVTYPVISAQELAHVFAAVVKKLPKPPQPKAHLTHQGRTLQEWLHLFSARLQRVRTLIFQETLQGATRQDTAMSFLAILEMARKQEVTLSQDQSFSHLVVKRIV